MRAIERRSSPSIWEHTDVAAIRLVSRRSRAFAPATGDPTQRRIMMIMPVMFTFMFINFPSGLVLYWLVNNLLTIAQQRYVLNRTAG